MKGLRGGATIPSCGVILQQTSSAYEFVALVNVSKCDCADTDRLDATARIIFNVLRQLSSCCIRHIAYVSSSVHILRVTHLISPYLTASQLAPFQCAVTDRSHGQLSRFTVCRGCYQYPTICQCHLLSLFVSVFAIESSAFYRRP